LATLLIQDMLISHSEAPIYEAQIMGEHVSQRHVPTDRLEGEPTTSVGRRRVVGQKFVPDTGRLVRP
jgi:hypothetical protein